jgi:hypothetical protein
LSCLFPPALDNRNFLKENDLTRKAVGNSV